MSDPISEMSYEQAFEALQEVIGSLETGEKPLEEAMALFERGQALYQRCNQLLDEAELRLQQLTESGTLKDFSE
jgi:exodeoxyribonuclease VII small subunit